MDSSRGVCWASYTVVYGRSINPRSGQLCHPKMSSMALTWSWQNTNKSWRMSSKLNSPRWSPWLLHVVLGAHGRGWEREKICWVRFGVSTNHFGSSFAGYGHTRLCITALWSWSSQLKAMHWKCQWWAGESRCTNKRCTCANWGWWTPSVVARTKNQLWCRWTTPPSTLQLFRKGSATVNLENINQ